MRPIRIGLLGTNVLGRQLYWLAQQNSGFEVVVLADAGDPAIVAQLLNRAPGAGESRLEGDEFIAGDMITRLVCRMTGFEVLWEAFDVDVVIDAAGVQQGDEPRVMAAKLRPHRDAVVRGSLELAASWCERRGIPLVLLALAQPSSTGAFRTRLDEIRPLVGDVGLEIVDITDAYDGHGDPESLWLRPWDRHPTSEGHALMAARLAELLQSRPELADLLLGPRRDRGVGASDG